MSNQLFPLFVKLEGRFCLVIGGGPVAARKIRALREASAVVSVISPKLHPDLQELASAGLIRWIRRDFELSDLNSQYYLVIVATNDPALSRLVFETCERQRILCSAVDDDANCNFHSPAVAERGDIKVAISTAGKSPAFAAHLKERLEAVLTDEDEAFLNELGRLRTRVQKRFPQEPRRRHLLLQKIVQAYRGGRRVPSESPTASKLVNSSDRKLEEARPGTVYLVGAGPGKFGLLTLQAASLLVTADVIFYDRLVGQEIIDWLPQDIEKVYVGKEAGKHYPDDIKELLVRSAREGKAVVRLKGGDPNLYGRGGEEMVALLANNVPAEVVPGVSALTAVPSAAGIPVTYRDLASQVVIRSGYRLPDPSSEALDAPRSDRTTFVYFMTVGRLTEIVRELRHTDGLSTDTPIAVVQKGTLPEQEILRGTLGDIVEKAKSVALLPPALVVAGDVVRFADRENILSFLDLEVPIPDVRVTDHAIQGIDPDS